MNVLDTPIKEMYCEICQITVKPDSQVRLTAEESGEATDCIAWFCPICAVNHFTPDDLSILDAKILML